MKVGLFFISICIVLSYATGCQKPVSNQCFHTLPDQWKKPRIFQTSVKKSSYPWDERISVEKHASFDLDDLEKHYSPNQAYWFQTRHSEKGTFQVLIFNEHQFTVIDTSSDFHYNKDVKWINEKLLYIRDWCGKVLGIDLLFDVEREEIVYIEEVHDGSIPYLQWQQNKISKND